MFNVFVGFILYSLIFSLCMIGIGHYIALKFSILFKDFKEGRALATSESKN